MNKCTSVAVISLSIALPVFAQSLPDSSTNAGCLARGATGYWVVENENGVREYLFVLDAKDAAGDFTPDGLPELAWCAGSSDGVPLTASSSSRCRSLNRLTSADGCKYAIDVWVGSAAANGTAAAPVDCSSNDRPVLMFGGDSADYLRGTTKFGDSLHGGDDSESGSSGDKLGGQAGNDYLCGGHGGDVIRGGGGDDVIWGGTGKDVLSGGAGRDMVQGAGGDDNVTGGAEADYVFGGGGKDTVLGGGGNDRVHGGTGLDTLKGGGGNDDVFAMDNEKDVKIDGGAGTDTCWRDSRDRPTACEPGPNLLRASTLANPVVVASHETEANLAWLYELGFNGALNACQSGKILDPTGAEFAAEVIGLAIDPKNPETLTALARFPVEGLQFVAVDLPAEPAHPIVASGDPKRCAEAYRTTLIGKYSSTTVIDIAYDGQGRLSALTRDAQWIALDTSTSTVREVRTEPVGRQAADWGHTQRAHSMAYDSPDGGFFLILTADPNPNDLPGGPFSCLDAFMPMASDSRSMPTEDHVAASQLGRAPFTVTRRTSAGSLLTLENVGSPTVPVYEMVEIQRQNWNRGPWKGPPPCPPGAACIAQIEHEFAAITVPQF